MNSKQQKQVFETKGFKPVPSGNAFTLSNHIAQNDIHILLVDHDNERLISTSKMLEMFSYKVSMVNLASTALVMLSNGWKCDLVLANAHSPDFMAFMLLQEAVKMDIRIIMMSLIDDDFLERKSIENGAVLVAKYPTSMELVKCLWQFVMGQRKLKEQQKKRAREMSDPEDGERQVRQLIVQVPEWNTGNVGNALRNKDKGKTEVTRIAQEVEHDENPASKVTDSYGKVVWTEELHGKFLDAVKQLGKGRCFPNEILHLMNVPGLKRLHVASHLQKCRNNTWRNPYGAAEIAASSSSVDGNQGNANPDNNRFGLMPYGENSSKRTKECQDNEDVGSSN